MVHVFNAGPMPTLAAPAVLPGGGTELFAFIPRGLFRGVAGAAATEDVTAIQALTYQDGGVPIYHHHMYVDSSPRAADVDFGNGAGDWHTIVVGGLGKGGNSYYALDLTDLNVPDEAAAANKVMWEWTNPDSDVVPGQKLLGRPAIPGFTFGRPVIVKVRDAGYPTGRWVVIVTGGYNNFSGKGKVFFIDAATGTDVVHGNHDGRRFPAAPAGWRRSMRSSRTRTTRPPSRSTAATCWATSGASTFRIRPTRTSTTRRPRPCSLPS